MESNTNLIAKITNNLSYAIDVYDVFNPEQNNTPVPFQYTKLDTIDPGETTDVQTIRPVSQLQAMYTGTIDKLDNLYFYQFPIKLMVVMQTSFDDPSALEFTIETTDEEAMVQSFLFHRYAMANPNSALTQSLYAALKAGSINGINSFFAGTQNFSACTLGTWNVVMTWLQMFTSGWQGPYYLYEKAPDPLPQGYVPVLVATMNIVSTASENSATLKICTEDAQGNPIYAADPQTTTIVMKGDGTMVDRNPGQDVPVSLTPVWMNVIQTTMKNGTPVSQYLAGPVATGTVVNQTVVSSPVARQIPNQPADKNKQSSFDATFNKICQGVGFLVGLLMLGEFAQKLYTWGQTKVEALKNTSTSQDDFNKAMQELESTPDPDVVSDATSSATDFDTYSSEVGTTYSDMSDALMRDAMTNSLEDIFSKIEQEEADLMNSGYTPSEDFENAFQDMQQSFQDAQEKIGNDDFSGASEELSQSSGRILEVLQQSGYNMSQWESQSVKESADALEAASTESDALDSAQEEYDSDMSDVASDSGYDSDDSGWPSGDEIEA